MTGLEFPSNGLQHFLRILQFKVLAFFGACSRAEEAEKPTLVHADMMDCHSHLFFHDVNHTFHVG